MTLNQSGGEIYEDDFNAIRLNIMLLAELAKVQIFNPYIIDAFTFFPASSHPIISRFSNFEVNFSSSCHADICQY